MEWLIHGFQQRPGSSIDAGGRRRRRATCSASRTAPPTRRCRAARMDVAGVGQPGARANRPGRSVAATWSFVSSGCSSSVGTDRAREQEAIIGRTKRTGRAARRHPRGGRTRLRGRPGRVGGSHSTRTSASPIREPPTPSPTASFAGVTPTVGASMPRASSTRGYVRVLPARSRRGVRDGPGPARRGAARGVHPARRRRLLLRAAGDDARTGSSAVGSSPERAVSRSSRRGSRSTALRWRGGRGRP